METTATEKKAGRKKPAKKQITLHFTQDTDYILDAFKTFAKSNFRTAEQEIVFALSIAVNSRFTNDKIEEVNGLLPPAPAAIQHAGEEA